MTTDVDLTAVARLIAEPARAAMLDALLSGQSLAAGELARAGGVQASTASGHLSPTPRRRPDLRHPQRAPPLLPAGVGGCGPRAGGVGRDNSPPRPIRSLRQSRTDEAMTFARTCYDHLAGVVAVALVDAFVNEVAAGRGRRRLHTHPGRCRGAGRRRRGHRGRAGQPPGVRPVVPRLHRAPAAPGGRAGCGVLRPRAGGGLVSSRRRRRATARCASPTKAAASSEKRWNITTP